MSAGDVFGLDRGAPRVRVPPLRALQGREAVTGNGIAQIAVYLVVLTLLAYPLAIYMNRVYAGTLRFPRWLTAPERGFYRLVGTRADEEQGWKAYGVTALVFMFAFAILLVCASTVAGQPPAEPGQPRRCELVGLDEHDRELRHEHELAVLRRRVHDVVPEPDGRARGAELRLGRARDGSARRRHPRIRAPVGEHRRELLGRPLPVARLHPPAARRDPGRGAHLAGRRPDLRRQGDRDDARRCHAGDRPRAGRERRSRSSSSARTAAASTTRTPPSPSRTRTPSRTSSR